MGFTPLGGRQGGGGFKPAFSTPSDAGFRAGPTSAAARAERAPRAAPEPSPVDVEALITQARVEGAAQERAQVEEERSALRAHAALLDEAVAQVQTLREALLSETVEEVGQLVLRLTERVLERSLALHPEALPTLLRRALDRFPDREGLSIRVPAEALDTLREVVSPEVAAALVADPTVSHGVVVSSRRGEVESTIEAAMEALEEAVRTWQEAASCSP